MKSLGNVLENVPPMNIASAISGESGLPVLQGKKEGMILSLSEKVVPISDQRSDHLPS